MSESIENIIGKEETDNLYDEMNELLSNGCNYDDMEDLFLSYGLEMDYLLDMLY